jgi:hypothetical protein
MDPHRFDSFARTIAGGINRRHLLGLLGGGALAFLGRGDAAAKHCTTNADCGDCKICQGGRCVAGNDNEPCRACGVCSAGHCRPYDVNCPICQRCAGNARRCVADPSQALAACSQDGCKVCEPSTGACVPQADGSDCTDANNKTGTCIGGACQSCACPECQICSAGQCAADPDQELVACGTDGCHVCSGGACVALADGSMCTHRIGTCCGGQCGDATCCPSDISCSRGDQSWCCVDFLPNGNCCCTGVITWPGSGQQVCDPCPLDETLCYCNDGRGGWMCCANGCNGCTGDGNSGLARCA